ncbi:MAG: sigma-70 family RNA polymerase sigma factor, partial [Alphaproteobacteria bacterium]|nr:sigma-70 family RNA polymerase sigma factor [Alphaproteobacteria bacterium]
RLSTGDQSLNAPVSELGEDEWLGFLADGGPTPEDMVISARDGATRSAWLAEALGELSEREQTIVRERRLREKPITLEALGHQLGISKERVRQIEHKALGKLRTSMMARCGESAAA